MTPTHVSDLVRLTEDVPSLGLRLGEQGLVVSVWLSPRGITCEVEFGRPAGARPVRALLRADQLEVVK